jgi:hypothetical protein
LRFSVTNFSFRAFSAFRDMKKAAAQMNSGLNILD